MKNVKGLIEHCKLALKNKVKYVYGAKMKVMSKQEIKNLQNIYGKSYIWDSDLSKAGSLCCDCSGLISSYTGIVRNSTNYLDTALKVVTIAELNKNWDKYVGWGLWMQGHIGVVSDIKGYYYAMDGSARNMVHNPMSKQNWKKCIKLKDIDYAGTAVKEASKVTATKAASSPVVPPKALIGATSGRVNLRNGASMSNSVLTVVPKGDKVNVEGLSKDGNWYKVRYKEYQGYMSSSYILLSDTLENPLIGIEILKAYGVIDSPDYWKKHYKELNYLEILIERAALRLNEKQKKEQLAKMGIDEALNILIKENIINDSGYWKKNIDKLNYLYLLIENIGSALS